MNDVPWGKCDFWGYSKRRIMATSSPQSILRRFPTTSAVQAFFMTCASLPALRGAPASSPAETNNGTMAVMDVHPQKRNWAMEGIKMMGGFRWWSAILGIFPRKGPLHEMHLGSRVAAGPRWVNLHMVHKCIYYIHIFCRLQYNMCIYITYKVMHWKPNNGHSNSARIKN